ncbi:MAG: hypothetical protein HRF43_09210 [Phycisphaerae bacterium]|jgi:hypothetical protein
MTRRYGLGLVFGVIWLTWARPAGVRAQCVDLAADDPNNVPPIGQFLCRTPGGVLRFKSPNAKAAAILSQLDIDGDGVPDGAPDTDGDGLPDNWETGGVESASLNPGFTGDRAVNFSAPTAIGPGTPPTFLFARLAVNTSAASADTDGDGLSDFVEVFGLKYIDENGNGRLDFLFSDTNGNGARDAGEPIDSRSEWLDLNGDGLPSIGEFPLANINAALNRQHDFDGFMFTDPTLADTDGDGVLDGADPDPLINPQTFGLSTGNFSRSSNPLDPDQDLDNDGLGNGSDFGNDLLTPPAVDFPTDIQDLLRLFRPDRVTAGTLPESLIEDLLGADWDGNGLFRITDQRDFSRETVNARLGGDLSANALFTVGGRLLFAVNPGAALVPSDVPYGERQVGMGYQLLLLPSQRTSFLPDLRVWTILYAWRMPGFDIDGDGFVGPPSNNFAQDDLHPFTTSSSGLDGRIDVGGLCGLIGLSAAIAGLGGFLVLKAAGRRRRPRGA